jgi:hypothetical protein
MVASPLRASASASAPAPAPGFIDKKELKAAVTAFAFTMGNTPLPSDAATAAFARIVRLCLSDSDDDE